jgi:hypothetical protein
VTSEVSARRAIVEGVTVVVGILLAFSIDAAWDGLGDRRAEAVYRSSLETELQTALRAFERKQRLSRDLDALLVSFLDHGPLPGDSLRAMIRGTTFVSNLQPPRSVLDDLVSSGRMQILRSRELREGLMRFRMEMDIVAANEQVHHQFVNERLVPGLAELVPIADLVQIQDFGAESTFLQRSSGAQLDRLQHDADFQNLMVERLRALRRGYSAIDRTAVLLEQLLGELGEPGS